MATTVTLRAPDISCGHCVMAIKKAVGKLPGVASVEGDPGTKQVKVVYEPGQVSLDKIEATMAEEGYPVAKCGCQPDAASGHRTYWALVPPTPPREFAGVGARSGRARPP